jgi:hypothetical protein
MCAKEATDIATTVTSMTNKLVVPVAVGAALTLGTVDGAELGALLALGPAEGNGQEDPGKFPV